MDRPRIDRRDDWSRYLYLQILTETAASFAERLVELIAQMFRCSKWAGGLRMWTGRGMEEKE